MSKQILIVGADPALRAEVARLVDALGIHPVASGSAAEAIARLGEARFDVCVVDLGLPADEGTAVVLKAGTCRRPVPAVALAAPGAGAGAVEALRAGAAEILAKPFCPAYLSAVLRRISGAASAAARRAPASAAVIGDHPQMRKLLDRVDQMADTDASVLIRGETGTGKEVIARLIHGASARRAGPFVAVNMAALPEEIAETELFGETGTDGREGARPGRVLAAHGGTLFLDEIGEMPRRLQARLLGVLQSRMVAPSNGAAVPIDLRVIASTHRDLEVLIASGRFRADLHYHLDVASIEIPPLRARREDIPALAEHFRREVNAREGRAVPGFALDVMRRLSSYDWPGNVRELEHLVERLVVLASTRMVVMGDLPAHLRTQVVDLERATRRLPESGVDLRVFMSELEERFIARALARAGGNRVRAAQILGIHRSTLVEKLRRRNVA